MTITDAKTNYIIDKALALFLKKSIGETTVRDIALDAGVGEATIYRYFSTKYNLVCAAAAKLERQIYEIYFSRTDAANGFEKLDLFYRTYLEIFSSRREFFKFIGEFDAYMISEGKTDVSEYASGLDMFRELCSAAYDEGLSDGSISPVRDFQTFYYATTHGLLELCKKLSAADIVRQDIGADREAEIETLTEIILHRLKKQG